MTISNLCVQYQNQINIKYYTYNSEVDFGITSLPDAEVDAAAIDPGVFLADSVDPQLCGLLVRAEVRPVAEDRVV